MSESNGKKTTREILRDLLYRLDRLELWTVDLGEEDRWGQHELLDRLKLLDRLDLRWMTRGEMMKMMDLLYTLRIDDLGKLHRWELYELLDRLDLRLDYLQDLRVLLDRLGLDELLRELQLDDLRKLRLDDLRDLDELRELLNRMDLPMLQKLIGDEHD